MATLPQSIHDGPFQAEAFRKDLPAHLPKLAQPFWYQLVGAQGFDARQVSAADEVATMSREARKVARRKARKAQRDGKLSPTQALLLHLAA